MAAYGSGSGGVLAGLSSKSPFAKGLAMQSAADLGMSREEGNYKLAMQRMQDDSQLRQQGWRNMAQGAVNASQERTARGAQSTRKGVFDTDMAFRYAGQNRGRQLQLQQSLLNNLAGDL